MPNSLKKIIDLVKENKERVVLFNDNDFNDGVVIMTLDEYQKIKTNTKKTKEALTEKDVIDNINNDIAVLTEKEKNESFAEWFYSNFDMNKTNEENSSEIKDDLDENENLYYYNDNESFTHFNIEQDNDEGEERKVWNIPVDIKEGAE